ncbi:MAG: helix-turn-helix domain-containing protein [Clostridia bacterium]|nr:helix-turn-helix domain-containing protein [Clostridia bacterium]
MSRLGDLLLLERTRQKMTRKQVARMCGISEGYLKDVEEGRRIIQDDQARRILKRIGISHHQEAEFSLDEIAATVDLQTLTRPQPAEAGKEQPAAPAAPKPESKKPAAEKRASENASPSGIWLDALSSVLKPVPIMNAAWMQIGRKLMPVQDGKICGANPDKVVWFKAPDNSMHSMRIEKDDLVLVVPQNLPVNGAIMLIEYGAHRCLRKIMLLGNSQILIQSGDRELEPEALHISDVRIVGRAVRVEISLDEAQ